MTPIKFWFNVIYDSADVTWRISRKLPLLWSWVEESGHPGNQNGKILAILNFHVAPMPPTKIQLNLTCGSEDVWRISKWMSWGSSWISQQNDFSNSDCSCCPHPSIKFWPNMSCDMWFPTMWHFDKCRLRRACSASF